MKGTATFVSMLALLLAAPANAQQSKPASFPEIERDLQQHRAIEAMIWGMPAVNLDLMYQAVLGGAATE